MQVGGISRGESKIADSADSLVRHSEQSGRLRFSASDGDDDMPAVTLRISKRRENDDWADPYHQSKEVFISGDESSSRLVSL